MEVFVSKVVFGAFYQNNVLYIEAFDMDNYIQLPMGVETAKPQNSENPTIQEKKCPFGNHA